MIHYNELMFHQDLELMFFFLKQKLIKKERKRLGSLAPIVTFLSSNAF